MSKKVSIIGAGAVGSNIAYSLMLKNIASEIALIDINNELAEAGVLDIKHGIGSFGEVDIHVGSYEDISSSDLIIVTAGRGRKPGETRLDMVIENVKVARTIGRNISGYYRKGIVMVVSNPVDIVTYEIAKILKIDRSLIFGTGCVLDTSRFVFVLADYLGVKVSDIEGYMIAEHGDMQFCPWSQVKVKGLTIDEYTQMNNIEFSREKKAELEKRVAGMGAVIIAGKGKTHFGISTCAAYLAEAILSETEIVASVSSCLIGEYGVSNIALSLPSIINSKGIAGKAKLDLSQEEIEKFKAAANSLKNVMLSI